MPQGNRTGPSGQGPMTGRKLGFCTGNNQPGCASVGFGRGRGMGYRRFQRFQVVVPSEKEALENEKRLIEERLKELE